MRKSRVNPLQLQVKGVSVPKYVYPKKYWARLEKATLQKLNEGEAQPLPERWQVDLGWRNPATKRGRTADWQHGEFTEVLNDSSESFAGFVLRMIEKKLAFYASKQRERKRNAAPKRKKKAVRRKRGKR